jgi:hypothetical protein
MNESIANVKNVKIITVGTRKAKIFKLKYKIVAIDVHANVLVVIGY